MTGNTTAGLLRRTVTGRDAYGNDVTTETLTVLPGIFSPGGSTEAVQGQDQVSTNPSLSLPTGTDVAAVDAVIPQLLVDDQGQPVLDGHGHPQGDRYEVTGDPQVWGPNPYSGWQTPWGVDLELQRVSG